LVPKRPLATTIAAALLAAPLSVAGLAAAGVELPKPAGDAFERLGLDLPNQASGDPPAAASSARSDEVQAIIDATPPSERGCEFGHRVAEAARGSELPEAARDACDRGQQRSARARGRAKKPARSRGLGRALGRKTAERAKQQRTTPQPQRTRFGGETAGRARGLGAAPQQAAEPTKPSAPIELPAPAAGKGGPPGR
jgi:hypothetical protein